MSGGRLVVLDRAGRENKKFDVPSGLVTLGSDPSCDVRILLSTVDSHHATIVVHTRETVIHNVGSGETLVNGASVSVAPLRQDDVVSVGGRELRWRYTRPTPHHTRRQPHTPVLQRVKRARARVPVRRSEAPPIRAANVPCRNSTPGTVSTRQVAIVQPQRRDTANKIEVASSPSVSIVTNVRRRRTSKSDTDMDTSTDKSEESRSKAKSPRTSQVNLQNTTKATLWIESRKISPRKGVKDSPSWIEVRPRRALSAKKSTPLRLTVLKKAQSVHKMKVTKIEAPSTIDHTKQAAIMLMTGHTPRKTSPKHTGATGPSFAIKKRSPVKSQRKSGRQAKNVSTNSVRNRTSSASAYKSQNTTKRSQSLSVIELQDSVIQQPSRMESDVSASTSGHSSMFSNPKKSALRDPAVKRNAKKTESIKFDLSNLENQASKTIDVLTITDSTQRSHSESPEDEISLYYSDSSPGKSPSPQKPINSRSGKILEKTLGTTITKNIENEQQVITPESPRSRKSLRGSMMLQKVLQSSNNTTGNSHEDTVSDQSWISRASSENKSKTSRPLHKQKMESYSIVDLVSNDSGQSIYNSVSDRSIVEINTPLTSSERNMRSLRAGSLLASSTPLKCNVVQEAARSQSHDTTLGNASISNNLKRRSKSLSTPVNVLNNETFILNSEPNECPSQLNSKNGSRATISSKQSYDTTTSSDNSRENSWNKNFGNSSPTQKNNDTFNVSMKGRKTKSLSTSVIVTEPVRSIRKYKARTDLTNVDKTTRSMRSATGGSPLQTGLSTPENNNSPEELGTPMLRIQSLLEGTANLNTLRHSKKGVARIPIAWKTISTRWSTPRKRSAVFSKSFTKGSRTSLRRSQKLSDISPNQGNIADLCQDDGDTTPKSAVKLIQEGVKNKHSTAKQPKSKRSIIDNLNESDIVKQLFNSPVKRKLSQSMIEFSRKQLLDGEATPPKKLTRNTIALAERTPDDSLIEQTHAFTPEVFVSPLSTPSNSPNLIGLKRLFAKSTPDNDLRDVRGVGKLMRTPRNKKYCKNDLTDVAGVKLLFARSPRNRLSDVQIKQLFAASPENDLTRVTGLRTLYHSQNKNRSPKNDLKNVAGVKDLFRNKSPRNDLLNVSGVKATIRAHSPKNDLSELEGVRNIFHRERDVGLNNISGIEELFSESQQAFSLIDTNAESSFDLLIGKPAVKAYPKAKSLTNTSVQKPKVRRGHSLKTSFSLINDDVENWLEKELKRRMHSGECSKQQYQEDENNSESSSHSSKPPEDAKSNSRNKLQLVGQITGNTLDEDCESISDKSKSSSRNVSKTNTSFRKSRSFNEVTPTKSLNISKTKSNLTRELLKLATDTIEGSTPVLTSRIRNSSLNRATGLKKSTSEIYGAHTLPIKKRSVVDTSKSSNEKNMLPIKKRMVLHSTPVKGRLHATISTLNSTEIGNVSPIAAADDSGVNTVQNTEYTTNNIQTRQDLSREGPKAKPERSRKTKPHPKDVQIESQSVDGRAGNSKVPLSPRNKEIVNFSPIQTRRTITYKFKSNIESLNVKKRKKSLVITKKSPGYSPNLNETVATVKPKPATRVSKRNKITSVVPTNNTNSAIKNKRRKNVRDGQPEVNEQTNLSASIQQSKETRSTRSQRVAPVQIPKKITRAKASNVTKFSPQSRPRSNEVNEANALESSPEVKLRETRRTVAATSKPKKSKLSKPNDENNVSRNLRKRGKKIIQNVEVRATLENAISLSKSKVNKKEIDDKIITKGQNGTKQIEKKRINLREKKIIGVSAQDANVVTASRTRSTRNAEANKNQVEKSNEEDKPGPSKPIMNSTETASRRHKRKLPEQKLAEEPAAKLGKSDIHDDIPKSSRRRKVGIESFETIEQNTRSKRVKQSDKLKSDEISSRTRSASAAKVGDNTNSRTVKAKTAQIIKTKNHTAVASEESVENKTEVKRSMRNTRSKLEQKTKITKEVQEIVPETTARTSRRNKTAEPEKPQTRQRNQKTPKSVNWTKDAPESPKPKRSAASPRVTRVTRARAAAADIDEQKPAARSRRW